MTWARAVWRLAGMLLQLVRGLSTCALVFPFLTPAQRMQRVGRWSAGMLRRLGVGIDSVGVPRPGPVLFVANHISWLDILAINAVQPARFVSKADVRSWPVLGWLVACGGTLFIERERKRDALRVLHEVAAALKDGQTVAVFPEGTTADGHALLPFHANLLQAAISTEVPVQAIALRYRDAAHAISPAAAFVGDTTLLQSLWWVASARGLRVKVTLLPPAGTRHLDRRALAETLREAIGEALNDPVSKLEPCESADFLRRRSQPLP